MRYRVIQWATGSMGKTCLRAVIDHPDLELVGLFVYSNEKTGSDAGEIARREPTGVIATQSIEAILALEADHRVVPAPKDIQGKAGLVRAGSVGATEWCWHSIIAGQPMITLSVNWIMGTTMPGYANYDHWKIAVRGKPGIDITMNLVEPRNTGAKTRSEQYAVAGSVINAIPEVCAAPAGIFHPPLFAPCRQSFSN